MEVGCWFGDRFMCRSIFFSRNLAEKEYLRNGVKYAIIGKHEVRLFFA